MRVIPAITTMARHVSEYMPDDEMFGRGRYAYWIIQQNLGAGFSTTINWNGVSDDYYWQDLTSRLLQTSQVQLPRQIVLGYAGPLVSDQHAGPAPDLARSIQQPDFPPLLPRAAAEHAGLQAERVQMDVSAIGQFSPFTHVRCGQGAGLTAWCFTRRCRCHRASGLPDHAQGRPAPENSLDEQASGLPNTFSQALPPLLAGLDRSFQARATGSARTTSDLEPRLYYVSIPYRTRTASLVRYRPVGLQLCQIFSGKPL